MSKEAYYFSHDSNAKNDPKIMAMISEFGMEGYGRFWVIVEMLREQESFELPLKKYVFNALAMQTQCDADAMHYYIDACINEYELFESDGELFWSNSLKRRMEKRAEKSEKAKKAAEARWKKPNSSNDSRNDQSNKNANALQTQSISNAHAMQNDAIKGKEIKEKEIKEKEIKDLEGLKNPHVAAIIKFWDENGFGFNNIRAKEKLLDWLDEPQFTEAGNIVLRAMELASNADKRNLNYLQTTLKGWLNNGVKTVSDANAEHQKFISRYKSSEGKNGSLFEPSEETKKRIAEIPDFDPEEARKLHERIKNDPDLPF